MKGPAAIPARLLCTALLAVPLLLSGCEDAGSPEDTASEAAAAKEPADASEASEDIVKKSIIRAEVDTGPTEAPRIEPEELIVPFPAKGAQPDAEALAIAERVLAAPAYLAGGPVTLRGHSDSRGSDAENLAASRRRAQAVRDFLVSKGVPAERITVVAMGEANPVAPNRLPDGSDDMEGRARNRRVEIAIDLPQVPPEKPQVPEKPAS